MKLIETKSNTCLKTVINTKKNIAKKTNPLDEKSKT